MRGVLPFVVVLSFALAGCAGDDPPRQDDPDDNGEQPRPPSPPPPPTAREVALLLDFGMQGCSGIAVVQPAPAATIAALLPEGFEPAEAPFPVVEQPSGLGALVVDLYRCETFSTATASLEDVWYGHVFTFVQPPSSLFSDRDLDADTHEYVFQMLAGEDILSVLWPAAGYDTHNGSTDLQGALPGFWQASVGDYAFESIIPASPQDQGSSSFQRYTRLPQGDHLIWSGHESHPTGSVGLGSLTVPAGSPFAGQGLVDGDRLEGQSVLFEGSSYSGMDLVLVRADP